MINENACVPARELQVPMMLSKLEEEIEALNKAVDSLNAKLVNVMLETKDTLSEAGEKEELLCDYAANLRAKVRTVRGIRNRVVSIERRLEV